MNKMNRRGMITTSGKIAGTTVLGLSSATAWAGKSSDQDKKLKVVCVGAHPDDSEVSCGGTIALLSELGHEIVLVYLSRGEAGIEGKSYDEAAKIRTGEALNACAVLNARAVFAGQIDGNVEFTKATRQKLFSILQEEKPDLVFTLWAVDSHPDHICCSILVQDAWRKLGRKFALYYYEATAGMQTQNFYPTDYVNITPVIEKKKKAIFAHVSQKGEEKYYALWEPREKFRGMESGHGKAEGFIHHVQSPKVLLP